MPDDLAAQLAATEEKRRSFQRENDALKKRLAELEAAQSPPLLSDALADPAPDPDPLPEPPPAGMSAEEIATLRTQVASVERERVISASQCPNADPAVLQAEYQTPEELRVAAEASHQARTELIERGRQEAREALAAQGVGGPRPAPATSDEFGGPRKPSMRDFLGLSFQEQMALPDSVIEEIQRGDQ